MKTYFSFLRNDARLLLFGFLCVFWGNFGQSFFLGLFGGQLKAHLQLSAAEYGAIYSFATLSAAIFLFWCGSWIDRWQLKHFTLFALLGLMLACLALFAVDGVLALLGALSLLRLFGQGLLPHVGITTMTKSFDVNRGKAISVAASAVPVGEVILPVFVVLGLTYLKWQELWLLIAVFTLVVLLPLMLMLLTHADISLPSPLAEKNAPRDRRAWRILISDRRFWFALPMLLSSPFFLTAIFIHQDSILAEKQWAPEWMATCFIVYGCCHWLSSILAGVLVDKFSGLRLLRFYLMPLFFSLLVLANFSANSALFIMLFLLGITAGASGPVVGSMWAEVYGTPLIGGIRATVSALVVLASSLSPVAFGWLIDINVGLGNIF